MSAELPILVLGCPPDALAPLRAALERDGRVRVVFTTDPDEARRLAVESADRARALEAELSRLGEAVAQGEEKLFAMLGNVVDLALPGALDRGIRIAELARKLALRFDVPSPLLHDLELAARLHELGRVITPDDRRLHDPAAPESERWQYTQSTVAVLRHAPELQGAAELIANLYENWDGTGHPDHWCQGQIPLRCRILRMVVDLFGALERPSRPALEPVLEELEEHVGTRYDPMVLVHLKALLGGAGDGQVLGASVLLPITELKEGMVLAEDLCTDVGLKLLARNTRLTPATLQIILRRHRIEPILQGAAVLRKTA